MVGPILFYFNKKNTHKIQIRAFHRRKVRGVIVCLDEGGVGAGGSRGRGKDW